MTETAIQAASMVDGAFSWSSDKHNCLVYPVGKQRARLLLGADMLSSFVDDRISVIRGELSTALQGWERTRQHVAADVSLTERQEQLRISEVGREIDRIEREMEQLDAFDVDRYLYEVAKASLMEDMEFGQMTSLLKKHILDRRGRIKPEALAGDPKASGEGTILVGIQTPPRSADLLSAVHEARESSPVTRDALLEGRILPFTWLLEWLLGNEQLGLELGRSELKAAKTLSPWEKDMDARLRALHREVIRRACCIRGTIDALELVQGSRNGPVRLKLRSDFIASFLPAFADYRSLSERFDRA
ncbi:MAG: hypothetical protein JET69_00530, partial [Methanomassiliicoccales archaeon]|nr:hypothetical protein [Methanomassiliicoccales archaeon]